MAPGAMPTSREMPETSPAFGERANGEQSPAPRPASNIQLFSGRYYAACAFGGMMACGATHWMTTPLDLIKILSTKGVSGLFTGGVPTALGYGVQGALKYGWYEYFKKTYSDIVGPDNAVQYKSLVYIASSASAELIADVGLCPFETLKIRMQTTTVPSSEGFTKAFAKSVSCEGVSSLYQGIYPLWARQIPYTVMKFASFENIVQMIYHRLPRQKDDYSKTAQTGVAFTAGYLAGILCAVVSHPADVMVSKVNATRGQDERIGSVLSRIYKEIGFRGLWNGLPIRTIMIGTLTGLQWMIYDSFKLAIGLPTTGGVETSKKT